MLKPDWVAVDAEDLGAWTWPIRGSRMRGVNLYHYYHLGARIHPFGDAEAGMSREAYRLRTAGGHGFVEALLESPDSPLQLVREEADQLMRALQVIERNTEPQLSALEVLAVKTTLREFERSFYKALKKLSVFEVERIGIYETAELIDSAELIFTPDILSKLSAQVITDWRAAGRCLGFEVPTASGFHTVRATESVIHWYYATITGDQNMKRKDRNWGAYVRNLNRHLNTHADSRADPKLISLIDQIREHHRNVVIHPEETLTPNEAYVLFNICQSVIFSFVTAITRIAASVASSAGAP